MDPAPIYLDHNASTPIDKEVLASMEPWLLGEGANPSSSHAPGRRARHALDQARTKVASALDCEEDEILFTTGGTEANNLAILGAMRAGTKKHIITCAAEHSSVLEPVRRLAAEGFTVSEIGVNKNCEIDVDKLLETISPETAMVSLMLANNEIGTIQPIQEIVGKIPADIIFHCDAIQAVGKIPVRFRDLQVGMLTIASHKIYGPPGAAALIKRKDIPLQPLIHGGSQENGSWPGTENLPALVGLGVAAERATARLEEYRTTFSLLLQQLREKIRAEFPQAIINTPETNCLPNTLNVSFPGCDGRALLIQLDLEGFATSLGSACASGSVLPSHVLLAMGTTRELAHSSLRISLGWGVDRDAIDKFIFSLKKILEPKQKFSASEQN